MPTKDDVWFANIHWDSVCIECQSTHNGICPNRQCAEDNYDPWGDMIPAHLYFMDGNNVRQYLENKRKLMEENQYETHQ